MSLYGKFKLGVYRKILYPSKIYRWKLRFNFLYMRTMLLKRCYLSPFTGEFGHLLAHYVPFTAYLYSKGVKVHLCGLEIHRPFYLDDKGNETTASYLELRDFFGELKPNCNTAPEPPDVAAITNAYRQKGKKSIYPYWDNDNLEYYFYHYRWWLLKKGWMKAYDLSKIYKTKDEDAAVLFPRKWNPNFPDQITDQLKNNGLNWNYLEIAKILSRHFTKVYVVGHPVFVGVEFEGFDNVEVNITADNRRILEICSNSKLIITQHSGVNNLGVYTDCKVLMIYNGGREIGDIGTTLAFRKGMKEKYPLDFAYTYEEIEDYVKNFLRIDINLYPLTKKPGLMLKKRIGEFIESAKGLSVAVIGETITDEFIYVSYEGQSMKSICPVFKLTGRAEQHQGGAAAIANHLRGFVKNVDLISNHPNDVVKTRYVDISDQKKHVEINKFRIDKEQHYDIDTALYDVVIVADFGHGFCELVTIGNGFHLMCQTNSNNFGFNRISKWKKHRKKSVCIDLREASLQMNKKVDFSHIEDIAELYGYELHSENLFITLGTGGSVLYEGKTVKRKEVFKSEIVDTIGAGDTFFAFASIATHLDLEDKLTIPSLAASLSTTWLCNQKSVTPSSLLQYADKFI